MLLANLFCGVYAYDVKFDDVPASGNDQTAVVATIRTPKKPLPAQIKINGTALYRGVLVRFCSAYLSREIETGV